MSTGARVTAAVWFLMLVNYLDRVAISFAGPAIMKTLAITPAAFGVVLSSFGVGYLLAQVPGGLLTDRWGAKPLLVVGPLLWALFTGATGLAATLAGFVIARTCFGASEGITATSMFVAITETFESKQRARVLAICGTSVALAPAVAGAFVGKLVGAYGWHTLFLVLMAPALLVALVNYLLIPTTPPAYQPPERRVPGETRSFREVLTRPSLWLLSLAQFAASIAFWGYLGWMPSYLALGRHLELTSMGMASAIPYVFALLGLGLGGWLGTTLHRFRPQVVTAFLVGAALSLFLAYRADSVTLAVTGLSGAALFLFGAGSPLGALMLDFAPGWHRASYIAIVNSAGQIAGIVGPMVVGFLVSASGTFATGFGFLIGALILGSGCALALAGAREPGLVADAGAV